MSELLIFGVVISMLFGVNLILKNSDWRAKRKGVE